MTTLAPPPAVTEYANAVRSHLAALDAETLDELTGGLEADLAEALSERLPDGGPQDLAAVTGLFGSPAQYAEELRVAAGVELPAPTPQRRPRLRATVRRIGTEIVEDWQRWRTEHRWFGAVVDFLVSLRPVWWVARGWAVFMILTIGSSDGPWGRSGYQRLALLLLIVASVMWGRGQLGRQRWRRRLATAVSIIAGASLLPLLVQVGSDYSRADDAAVASAFSAGYDEGLREGRDTATATSAAATSVGTTNLFVYDAAGDPVENAQVLDQDGDPLVLSMPGSNRPWDSWDGYLRVPGGTPSALFDDEPTLNVYPYSFVPSPTLVWSDELGRLVMGATDPEPVIWPAPSMPPLDTATTGPSIEPTAPSEEPS